MQADENKTLHTITRYDGLKTTAFVLFCLVLSLLLIGGALVLWFAS